MAICASKTSRTRSMPLLLLSRSIMLIVTSQQFPTPFSAIKHPFGQLTIVHDGVGVGEPGQMGRSKSTSQTACWVGFAQQGCSFFVLQALPWAGCVQYCGIDAKVAVANTSQPSRSVVCMFRSLLPILNDFVGRLGFWFAARWQTHLNRAKPWLLLCTHVWM